MKTFKIVMNVFGIIGASFLSILLVIALMATPMVSAVTAFFQGENITKIVTSVDYTEIITAEMDMSEIGATQQAEIELFDELMDSEMMKDIIELCVDNIFAVMEGTAENNGITAEDIKDIAEEHMDELKAIVKTYIGDTIPLTEETLDEMTTSLIDECATDIAEMMPTAEDLGLDDEVLNVIVNLRNGTYFWIVFGITAGLTLLVMLCQVMRFKGFMWIGVDYLVAAVFTLISSFAMKAADLSMLLGDEIGVASVFSAATGIIFSEMLKCAGIMALLGVLFIVIFVVGRKLLKKSKTAKAEFAGV